MKFDAIGIAGVSQMARTRREGTDRTAGGLFWKPSLTKAEAISMKGYWVGLLFAAQLSGQPVVATVNVCVEHSRLDRLTLQISRRVVDNIYRRIGVDIEWRCAHSSFEREIDIRFVKSAAKGRSPAALAFTAPSEGRTVWILLSRLHQLPEANREQVIGFLMAHEMGHLLQGVARHSARGIMKASWTAHDLYLMAKETLNFEPEDIDLIHRGLRQRMIAQVPRETPL